MTVFFQPAKIALAIIIVKSGKVLQWAALAARLVETRTCFKTSQSGNHEEGDIYRICSRNLHTFFPILAAEKSGCVKYADFFVWRS